MGCIYINYPEKNFCSNITAIAQKVATIIVIGDFRVNLKYNNTI